MVKFGGHNLNGFTPNLTGRIRPGISFWAIGCKFTGITFVCLPVHSMAAWLNLVVLISMDLHPIRPVKFDRALNTGQIGWKFTGNTLYASLVELGIIPMNSTGIYLNGFTPNSTGQIQPGIKCWSNWLEIH